MFDETEAASPYAPTNPRSRTFAVAGVKGSLCGTVTLTGPAPGVLVSGFAGNAARANFLFINNPKISQH